MIPLNYPAWLPFIGWINIETADVFELGLPVRDKWQLLVFDWFGFGFIIAARPYQQQCYNAAWTGPRITPLNLSSATSG